MQKHCFKCDGNGFIEYFMHISAGLKPSIQQCPECKDVEKYAAEVKKRIVEYRPKLTLVGEP